MKKYLTSFVFLVVFAGYAALQYLNSSTAAYAAPAAIATSTSVPQPATDTVASSQSAPPLSGNGNTVGSSDASEIAQTPTPTPAPAQQPQGQYADGTYTGTTENAFYGLVQVQVTVSGGRVANVQFLQYPNDRSTSRFINQQAMPILAQEAVRAQSANVDGVSGASDTSAAFVQSLGSALAQARA